MSEETMISAQALMEVRPLTHLRGLGCLDEAGQPREDLTGVLSAAACRQFEAAEVAPQEVATLYEAVRQCLDLEDGTAFERFQHGVDHAMDVTAELLDQDIHHTLYYWVMEWQPFMVSDPCLEAFLGHLQSVVATYGWILAMKERGDNPQ